MQSGDPYATCTHRQVSLLTFMSVCSFLHFCNIDVQRVMRTFLTLRHTRRRRRDTKTT
ncbi:hypothetical protein ARMGADRAFT_411009 [Armillaria gallica]|uniref:Uncharacterized protein n=1 Tax=Armillaria gallica TaxID=47427 RepID=A0A2H3EJJ7_ARMGA|nr:hypothetical protein ARMGADRAFT_411009 [Armillaria gallica]